MIELYKIVVVTEKRRYAISKKKEKTTDKVV